MEWLSSMTIWCHNAQEDLYAEPLQAHKTFIRCRIFASGWNANTNSIILKTNAISILEHTSSSLTYLEELIVFNVDTKNGCYKRMVLLNPILPALQICGRKSRDGHKQIQKNPDPLFLNNLHVPCLYPPKDPPSVGWMRSQGRGLGGVRESHWAGSKKDFELFYH